MNERIILQLMLLLLSHHCLGQEIAVLEMREVIPDTTFVKNPVLDLNQDTCAVLKIYTDSIRGLSFSGMIVGQVLENEEGNYTLFMPKGTKRVYFNHDDYLPGKIDFASSNIIVKSSKRYEVILKKLVEEKKISLKADDILQYLQFRSKKPLEYVIVNGEKWNISNNGFYYVAMRLVSLGHYEYSVKGVGEKPLSGNVDMITRGAKKTIKLYY